MTIGLIDEDWISRKKMTFPNLSLMKIGAYHRQQGDTVEWYEPLMGDYDMVYSSRVFSEEYTKPFSEPINAVKVIRGGPVMRYLSWMAKRFTAQKRILHCHLRLITYTLHTTCMESPTQPMDF